MAEDELHETQKIRVKRGLIKNLLSQPIACGDSLGPFIVDAAIAGEKVKERNGFDLEQVEEANRQSDSKYGERINDFAPERRLASYPSLIGAWTTGRGLFFSFRPGGFH